MADNAEMGENDLNLDVPLSDFFSMNPALVFSFVLPMIIYGRKQYHEPTSHFDKPLAVRLSWCAIVFLLLSFFIHLAAMKIQNIGIWTRCNMAYLSTILRMLAAAFLLLSSDAIYMVVVLPLLLLALVLVIFLYCVNCLYTPGTNWRDHRPVLQRQFDMSTQVVSMAFAGLTGLVLGNIKGSSKLTHGNGYMAVAPECFLFYSILLGLLVVLLSTVPPRIWHIQPRERMARVYMPILAYAALFSMAQAGGVVAAMILREYVFLVCLAIVVTVVLFMLWEIISAALEARNNDEEAQRLQEPAGRPANADEEQKAKQCRSFLSVYMVPLFVFLMATHSKYNSIDCGSSVPLSWWFKGLVLSAVCIILIHAVQVMDFTEDREMNRWTNTMAWTYATIATVAINIAFGLLVAYLHPDDFKNIF